MDIPILLWLTTLSGVDLRERRLPNVMTVPVVVAGSMMSTTDRVVLLSMVVAAGPYLVSVLVGGCGGGDLKLAAGVGAILADPVRAVYTVAVAALLTLVAVATAAIADRGRIRGRVVAHGPALAIAVIVTGGLGP